MVCGGEQVRLDCQECQRESFFVTFRARAFFLKQMPEFFEKNEVEQKTPKNDAPGTHFGTQH